MDALLNYSRKFVLIAVIALFALSLAAFILGAVSVFTTIRGLIETSENTDAAIRFIELMETFLIATGLLIFAIGLYELFIREVAVMPVWLEIKNLHDLKAKLGGIVVLVMAITFLKHFVRWEDPLGTLFFATSTAVVASALVAFSHFGGKD